MHYNLTNIISSYITDIAFDNYSIRFIYDERTREFASNDDEYTLATQMSNYNKMLDSMKVDPIIKDVWLANEAYSHLNLARLPFSREVIDTLKSIMKTSACFEMIEKLNERYIALENREFDKLVLKSSDNLAGISEGEQLLKKIIEPYKGKFIILDIWGTWCGPCKEALSHSTEEYARLKDYDIDYLYLANNSPQASWENFIKEYNVSGDNVAHYNLPKIQQDAIERYLDVNSWPTYKLIDREGRFIDMKIDARDLENLTYLLEKLK